MKKSIFIVCLTLCFASSGASSNDFFAQYDEFSFAYAERKQHGVLDPLLCNQKPHSLFICDKGVFSQTEKFELSNSAITKSGTFFYCMNGKPLDAIPPWLFYRISQSGDLEETLVIKDDLSSVAYVTRERSFSRNKGYTWSEDKFYCEIENAK